jgi:hypothetical protein
VTSQRCGDPNGFMWRNCSLPFSGVAKSIRCTGPVESIYLDDTTVVQDVPPSCTNTIYWLWDLNHYNSKRWVPNVDEPIVVEL